MLTITYHTLNLARALSNCGIKAPVFSSKPMFYQADPMYRNLVNGLPPANEADHDTYLLVEPWTGACMVAHQRLQINLHVAPHPFVKIVQNVTPVGFYLPIMWADEMGTATDDIVNQFKGSIGLALKVANDTRTAGLVLGSLLLTMSVALVLFMWKQILDEQARADEDTAETTSLINSSS